VRKEKQLLLDEIKEKVESSSFILMSYQNLSANVANEFRSILSSTGGDFEVVRKRILMKALEISAIDVDKRVFDGHIGVIVSKDDPMDAIKTVFKFSKDNGDIFNVVAGRIEGRVYSSEDVATLSKLPGKDQMRAELLGLFEAPMSQTLSVVEALLTSVCHCLQNKSDAAEA